MILRKTNAEWEETLSQLKTALDGKILLPVRISYRIVKNKLSIEQAITAYRITRDEIINGNSDGQGHISEKDDPEKFEKVCMEIASIANEHTDIDILELSLSELGQKELPLDLMSALGFMITAESI